MRALFFAGILFGVYAFGETFGGAIEGHYRPVVTDVRITQTEEIGALQTRFWGEFRKVRECQFQGIEFYVGEPGNSSRVDFRFEEGSKVRGGV